MTVSRSAAGFLVVLASALSFAGNTSLAVIAYRAGTDPITMGLVRFSIVLVILYVYLRIIGIPLGMPKRVRYAAWVLGVLMAAQSGFLLASLQHINVGLAILTLYLYPLLVGIIVGITGEERISPALWACLAGAFVGLALALDVTGADFNPTGVGLATLAAVLLAVLIVGSARIIAQVPDSRPITLQMHVSGSIGWIVVCLVLERFNPPGTTLGMLAFIGVPVLYAIAITTFFIAVGMIGSVKSSMIMNIEPVASIAFGFVLLGQTLGWLQLAGAALVIASILALKYWDSRPGRRAG